MTCKDCLHFDVCQALEDSGQISKIYPSQCGCFKDKSQFVEIVRCKDCKSCDKFYPNKKIGEEPELEYFCEKEKRTTRPDDFCSYGERKDG